MDEGGEWKNDLWVDFCADRYVKLLFQGVGAHPWILERRNGLARGIYNRMISDGRFSGRQLITEVQFCLNAMVSTSGFPHTNWFLEATLRITLDGETGMRTSYLLRTPP